MCKFAFYTAFQKSKHPVPRPHNPAPRRRALDDPPAAIKLAKEAKALEKQAHALRREATELANEARALEQASQEAQPAPPAYSPEKSSRKRKAPSKGNGSVGRYNDDRKVMEPRQWIAPNHR